MIQSSKDFLDTWKDYIPSKSIARKLFDNKVKKGQGFYDNFDWEEINEILLDAKRSEIVDVIRLLLFQKAGVATAIFQKMYNQSGERNEFLEEATYDEVEMAILEAGGTIEKYGRTTGNLFYKEIKWYEGRIKSLRKYTEKLQNNKRAKKNMSKRQKRIIFNKQKGLF